MFEKVPNKLAWLTVFALSVVLTCTAEETLYAVKKGDTLSQIAREHHLNPELLAKWNALPDADHLRAGAKIYIPEADDRLIKYVVQKGDSLADICYAHSQPLSRVTRVNNLASPDKIYPGQTLLLPLDASMSMITPQLREELEKAEVKSGRWKYIVVHHSGSQMDSPQIMDNYHRRVRKMENGLAYHFVVGGSGPRMEDGEVYIGDRWKEQLQGGHVASDELNDEALGICLVGNFNNAPPTPSQMRALSDLIEYLEERCRLNSEDVFTHNGINPKPTQCPGRKFSLKDLRARLKQ